MYRNRAKGFLLPAALFLLVIMLLLAAYMVNIQGESHRGSAQEIMSVRAYYAAESGANWALNRLFFPPAAGASTNAICNSTVNGTTINYSQSGLNSCSASVSCVVTPLTGSGGFFYRVTSTGSCGVGQVSATRVVRVQAKL